MPAGRPLKFKSVRKLQEKIDEYFNKCDEEDIAYGIVGLAVHLDTSRETLINYEKREKYFDTIKAAKQRCQASVEKLLLSGKAQPGAIFWMKNHGWTDKQQIDINDVTELDDNQLAAKLKHLLKHK